MSSWIRNVTDEEFEKEVVQRSHELPVVVDFWAEWCGPCRVLGPTLEKLAVEGNGSFVLAKVDVDRSPRHAQAFGVRGIPAVMGFRNGQLVAEFTGALPEEAVRQFLRNVCPSEADGLFARAEQARPSRLEEAEKLYRQALDVEPGHQGALVGLSELLVAAGKLEEAENLLEGAVPGGPLGERVENARAKLKIRENKPDVSEAELRKRLEIGEERGPVWIELGKLLAAEKRYPEALAAFLEAAKSSPELAQGEAKELMVDLFHVVGVRSPLADEYRTKLSRLLY